MSAEHFAAVVEHTSKSGSWLAVLLLIAHHADRNGEWIIDQPTLQRWSRLTERRFRQVLTDLVTARELAIVSHHGRGKRTTYRLLREPENRLPAAITPGTEAAHSQFSSSTPAAHSQFSAPPAPPCPPDPLIPPYPPETKEADPESSALAPRPLSGPQSAIFRANLLLEDARVPLPSPGQIGLWVRTLGGIEPLLELLRRLIQAGLATKKNPAAYIHRVVMDRAARPEPVSPLDTQEAKILLRTAGADDARRQQALRIIAKARGEQ